MPFFKKHPFCSILFGILRFFFQKTPIFLNIPFKNSLPKAIGGHGGYHRIRLEKSNLEIFQNFSNSHFICEKVRLKKHPFCRFFFIPFVDKISILKLLIKTVNYLKTAGYCENAGTPKIHLVAILWKTFMKTKHPFCGLV